MATLSLIGQAGESKAARGPTAKKYKPGLAHVNGSHPLPRPRLPSFPPSRLFSSPLLLPLVPSILFRAIMYSTLIPGRQPTKGGPRGSRERPQQPACRTTYSQPEQARVMGHSRRYTHGCRYASLTTAQKDELHLIQTTPTASGGVDVRDL